MRSAPGSEEVADEIAAWFRARIPSNWFCRPLDVVADRDEIIVLGSLLEPASSGHSGEAPSEEARSMAMASAAKAFRESTRDDRMRLAKEAEHRFERTVSWGVRMGDTTLLFTTASVPVMSRLRFPERQVLDTLIDAGVARSRSDALAWCVRLVGQHTNDWLVELRAALRQVVDVRERGPRA